jgi:hypothetical protein
MARRKNPAESRTALYVAGGALGLGLLAAGVYFATKKNDTGGSGGGPGGGSGGGDGTTDPKKLPADTTLPTFDPSNTDKTHAYVVLVTTKNPVKIAQLPAKGTLLSAVLTEDMFGTNPVVGLSVLGPIEEKDAPHLEKLNPMPDVVFAVAMNGQIIESVTKQMLTGHA